jgi:hypothetical protein
VLHTAIKPTSNQIENFDYEDVWGNAHDTLLSVLESVGQDTIHRLHHEIYHSTHPRIAHLFEDNTHAKATIAVIHTALTTFKRTAENTSIALDRCTWSYTKTCLALVTLCPATTGSPHSTLTLAGECLAWAYIRDAPSPDNAHVPSHGRPLADCISMRLAKRLANRDILNKLSVAELAVRMDILSVCARFDSRFWGTFREFARDVYMELASERRLDSLSGDDLPEYVKIIRSIFNHAGWMFCNLHRDDKRMVRDKGAPVAWWTARRVLGLSPEKDTTSEFVQMFHLSRILLDCLSQRASSLASMVDSAQVNETLGHLRLLAKSTRACGPKVAEEILIAMSRFATWLQYMQ